jgi:hypothetical protein
MVQRTFGHPQNSPPSTDSDDYLSSSPLDFSLQAMPINERIRPNVIFDEPFTEIPERGP